MLSQNLTKGFDIKYVDKNEKEQYVWQTCYGPAYSRIYAALLLAHGDNKGVVLPFKVASTQVVIIPISKKGNEGQITNYCRRILQNLLKLGVRAELDVSDKRPGYKFNEWEMKGAALRFEVGERELKSKNITVSRRDTGDKSSVKFSNLTSKFFDKIDNEILQNLKNQANKYFKNSISKATTLAEIGKIIEKKAGFVRVNFCSRGKDGEKCADKIKGKFKAEVRGTLHGKNEKASGKCPVCGKKATVVMYVAKAY